MAKFKSVDDYIAVHPHLAPVRDAIRKAAPQAEESISYNMPTYKLNGEPLLYFAGWKKHFSLYPVGLELARELGVKTEKSTLKFPLSEPVPVELIARIARRRKAALA